MKQTLLSHDQVSELCLELALLFHAGVDGGSGLDMLAEEIGEQSLKTILKDAAGRVDEGQPLSEALMASGVFPEEVGSMLHVGEVTGRLEEALQALSRYYARKHQTEQQLRSALLYPSVLMVIMLCVIVVMLTKVLPIFNDVYASMGGSLTGLAGGLMELGQWLSRGMPVLCVLLFVVVAGLLAFSASGSFRNRLLMLWQEKRGHKGLSKKLATARFSQGLAMAISSGLSHEDALTAAGKLTGTALGQEQVTRCLQAIHEGTPLPRALRESRLMPATECRLLELGLASGSSEAAMDEAARRLQAEAENAVEQVVGQVEPAMVVTTSLLVGAILLSVMLPLTQILSLIG